jgi:hypothetical protein
VETDDIAYSVAPQFGHETRTCKLDCISLTIDTAKRAITENANTYVI